MIRAAVLLCLLALPLRAETVAEQAAKASADLQMAVAESLFAKGFVEMGDDKANIAGFILPRQTQR